MERVNISAATRKETGKSAARHMRARGQVPAVLYGRGKDPVALEVDIREMSAELAGGKYATHVYDLKVSDEGSAQPPVTVMIKEVQRDPIDRTLFNIDFHAISLTEKVQAQVPLALTGEPVGVKQGGILERLHPEITVSCLPTSIPEQVEIDISAMEIGDSIHASDLSLPSDVELLTPPKEVLIILAPPAKVVEEVPAPVEGEEEAAEPEVTAQKGEAPAPEEGEKKEEK